MPTVTSAVVEDQYRWPLILQIFGAVCMVIIHVTYKTVGLRVVFKWIGVKLQQVMM